MVFEVSAAVEKAAKVVDRRAHHTLAEKCAAASIVLLENDGVLPLESRTMVALIGQFAAHPRYQGAGSSRVNPTALVDLKDALEDSTLELTGYYRGYSLQSAQPDAALIEQAVEGAKQAQVVLMCIGLKTTPAVTACLINGIEPVLSPIWVALAHGEIVGPMALIGCVIVVVSVIAYNLIKEIQPSKAALKK